MSLTLWVVFFLSSDADCGSQEKGRQHGGSIETYRGSATTGLLCNTFGGGRSCRDKF